MKKEISPVVLVIAILMVLALVGFFYWRGVAPSEQPSPNLNPKGQGQPGRAPKDQMPQQQPGGMPMQAPTGQPTPNSPG